MGTKILKQDILSLFNENSDITKRTFTIKNKEINLYFIDCLINKELFASGVVTAIKSLEKIPQQECFINVLENQLLGITSVKKDQDLNVTKAEIFNGGVIVCVEGEKDFLILNLAHYSTRAISEPPNASVVRGPREGFIEDAEINISMIRRRLKTTTLAIKRLSVGKRTQTKVVLMYLDNVVNPYVVQELEKRIENINIDGIIDSYYLEELLETNNEKFFKRLGNTEKPDVATSRILEGRVAIIVDGSPIVLTAPFILFEDMQAPSDYYDIPARASFVRFVRLIGLMFAIFLPGIYVALQSYHYRLLPINFLISILSSIEGISFPPILEILFVLFLFEILNEASVRMPKQLGMALSIIGALVLGDTAVQAGLITPPSIVVVAISGITLYIIPNQASEASMLRTLFTVIGGIMGFYGIFLGFIVLTSYLVSIQSYRTPYMAPYGPGVATDKKDGFIKKSLKNMVYRPKSFMTLDSIRLQPKQNKVYKVLQKNKNKKRKSFEKEQGRGNGIN